MKCANEFQAAKTQTIRTLQFGQEAEVNKQKDHKDPKEEESKRKRSQAIFCGQSACAKLKEAFDLLSQSLSIQVKFDWKV